MYYVCNNLFVHQCVCLYMSVPGIHGLLKAAIWQIANKVKETLKKENKELKQKVHNIDKLELDNKILNTTLESNENEVIRLINEFNSEIDELKKNAYKCDDCDECFGTKSKFHLRNIF